MQALWKLTASPRHLLVFESAARCRSFTKAGSELNVSQPAISTAIRQLEAALGVTLFHRQHRQITLTPAGEHLFRDVAAGFERILESARNLSAQGQRNYVTLSASTAFANYWMVPQLSAFHQAHPLIDLRLQTSDREPDIDGEGISLAIRRGNGNWAGCSSYLLAQEVIFPIAAPSVMQAAQPLKRLSELAMQPLIHLEEPIRERRGWAQYFAAFNIQIPTLTGGLRLNDYALVLQAAMAGEGFAFGWRHVTRALINADLLEAHSEWAWHTGMGFYLVWSNLRPLSEKAALTRDWLIEAAE